MLWNRAESGRFASILSRLGDDGDLADAEDQGEPVIGGEGDVQAGEAAEDHQLQKVLRTVRPWRPKSIQCVQYSTLQMVTDKTKMITSLILPASGEGSPAPPSMKLQQW